MTEDASGWNRVGEAVALAVHDELLAEFGGSAGVRDSNLLGSALARPRNLAGYGSPDAAALAAAYAFGLTRNHPFVDGNKRTAYAIALVFLMDNGCSFIGTDVELVEIMLAAAAGEITEDALAVWFRDRIKLTG